MTTEVIDSSQTLIAYLLCAESDGSKEIENRGEGQRNGKKGGQIDGGALLRFDPMSPSNSYTMQPNDDDRLIAVGQEYLVRNAADIIGDSAEAAIMAKDRLKWIGFRRIKKGQPRGVWIAGKSRAIYELHYREVFANGESTYNKRIVAVSASGRPIPCVIEGTKGSGIEADGEALVMCASIIEDAHRAGCFLTRIHESADILFPVPYGEQIDLFKLRDAPLSPSGRRKAILHWVASHLRKTRRGFSEVKEHTRGVHSFSADGLAITLSANDTPV